MKKDSIKTDRISNKGKHNFLIDKPFNPVFWRFFLKPTDFETYTFALVCIPVISSGVKGLITLAGLPIIKLPEGNFFPVVIREFAPMIQLAPISA